ncbi:Cloroperoxidase [Xylariaceae sp. FL0594]|nr:Cloroperoxidase [Xylariaceae sp. FL0594]
MMQFLPLLALVTACVAGPIASRAVIKPYVKPLSTDSRGPCPMLNTLANHGYLPHNGRNITAADIGQAIYDATNWHPDFGIGAATGALKALGLTALDLLDLDSPAGGEHPASLTRADASSGDSNTIVVARVSQLLADSGGVGVSYLTIDSVARSRNRVDATAVPLPTEAQIGVGQAEAALLMLLMRDTYFSSSLAAPSKLRAPKDRTRVWLLEERFPTAYGWKPAEQLVQLADLGPISDAIVAAQAAQKGQF